MFKRSKLFFSKRDKKTIRIAIIVILTFSAIIGFICFEYYQNLRKTIFTESTGYLSEISKQMATNASRIMEDNYAVLETVASLLRNNETITFEDFKKIGIEQSRYWHYEDLMLLNEEGILYDSNGQKLTLPNNEYLAQTIIEQRNAMSSSILINDMECIVFSIPIPTLHIGNQTMVALCASYHLDTFDEIIDTNAFGGKAYTHIIDKKGSLIVRSNSPYADKVPYNLLSYLETNVTNDSQSITKLQADIAKGKPGIISNVIDGVEKYISYYPIAAKEWCLVTFVPVSVVNEKSNMLMQVTAIFCIFITALMVSLIFFLALNFIKHNKKLESIAFIDPVTNGHTMQHFQILTEKILTNNSKNKFAMVYINIEKFKVINDQFGRISGNSILKAVTDGITSNLSPLECISRVMADHFCVLVQYEEESILTSRFELWHTLIEDKTRKQGLEIIMPSLNFGVYVINVSSMPIPFMVDRAKLSLNEIQTTFHSKIHYSVYDERTREQMVRQKHLEDRMEIALQTNEFEVYLQPKYVAATREIGGAEALIRWNGPNGKMIYPDEFIPLFEQNGFIIQADMWVFEQVCKFQKRNQNAGRTLYPISLNCSRLHLNRTDFVESYRKIFEKYEIPASCIEIELTESVVYEDSKRLLTVIDEIHAAGFTCSIDDFGSGYSSLNMIQDIPVDVLKLDKIFFRDTNTNNKRAQSVIGGIISMAQALSMYTVAEGVEIPEQVEMLQELGCDLIQGYVFAKPMPIPAFEELAYFD